MLRLSKGQFSRAIEGSDVTTDPNAAPYAQKQPRRSSKYLVTALVVALGIGAGWVGGKVLNGRMSHAPNAPAAADVSTGDNPAPTSQPQPESRSVMRADTAEKPVTSAPPAPDVEQPAVAPEPRPKESKEAEAKEVEPKAPPKVPRVEKDEEAEKAGEDPSKEIGRKALKKINKDINNMNGNSPGNKNEKNGNKNENPDRHRDRH